MHTNGFSSESPLNAGEGDSLTNSLPRNTVQTGFEVEDFKKGNTKLV